MMNRRAFLLSAAPLTASAAPAPNAYAKVRGFNYMTSYARTGFEQWTAFDRALWRKELQRGKTLFPGINAIRFWLDWQAFEYESTHFTGHLEAALDSVASVKAKAIPVLFNRWHDNPWDWGGIYTDHFSKDVHIGGRFDRFANFLEKLVAPLAKDERVLMWDLCNEPQIRTWASLSYSHKQHEFGWLEWCAQRVRSFGVTQPITIGTMMGDDVEIFEPLVDVVSCHPYFGWQSEKMGADLDRILGLTKKPVIATETITGSLNDGERGRIIQRTLKALSDRQLGWTAWTLQAGRMISTNRAMPAGTHGYMAFVEADGRLRPHHGFFNDF